MKGIKAMKDKKKVLSPVNIILIIQLAILLILSVIITVSVSSKTKKSSLDQMTTITEARAEMIKNYVEQSESVLTYYSKAEQITNLLRKPNDPDAIAAAQAYTTDYSQSVDNLEGIYVSKWDTTVLAHTNSGENSPIGKATRSGDGLEALHQSLLAADTSVYNTGIIMSPASGEQIVSMYKAVFDENNEPIGLVGLGIYTEGLLDKLDALTINNAKNAFYSMINIKDNKYIFSKDSADIGTEIEIEEIKKLAEKYKNVDDEVSDNIEYKSGSKKYVSTYTYIPEYDWILTLDDTKSEIFSLTNTMRIYLGVFFIAILILFVVFGYISRAQTKVNDKLSATMVKNEQAKENLYTAMFKDVLTDVNNRISLSVDIDKCEPSDTTPYYFAMINLKELSTINLMYGNDIGDWALVKTADVLGKIFKDDKVYRTGSGEFLVMIKSNGTPEAQQRIISDVSTALNKLQVQNNTPAGRIVFAYDAAMIKKTKDINTSVVTVLKNIIRNPEPTGALPFVFKEI